MKKFLKNRGFEAIIITLLVFVIGFMYTKILDLKYSIINLKAVPDIELSNGLYFDGSNFSGSASGFVKFNIEANQPKELRQYYIITPADDYSYNSDGGLNLENIAKLSGIPPSTISIDRYLPVKTVWNQIVLEDEEGNQLLFNSQTRDLSILDATGDSASLVTDEYEFGKFMRRFLQKYN